MNTPKFTMEDIVNFNITGRLPFIDDGDEKYDAVVKFINEWLITDKRNEIDSISQFRNIPEKIMKNDKQKKIAKKWIPKFRELFDLKGPIEKDCTKLFRKIAYKLRYSLFYNIIDKEKIFYVVAMQKTNIKDYTYADFVCNKFGINKSDYNNAKYVDYMKEQIKSPNDSDSSSDDDSDNIDNSKED